MYPYNEEVAWQRLKDVQREMENSRLLAEQGPPALGRLAVRLGRWVWAMVEAGRRSRSVDRLREEPGSAKDAA
jgi:hypothetical protein